MAKNNLKELIDSLVEAQQNREDDLVNMRLSNVRVQTPVRGAISEYYAALEITQNDVIIKPHDRQIDNVMISSDQLRGYYYEENEKTVTLTRLFNKTYFLITCRTPRQMFRIIRRLQLITGEETTSESLD